MADLKWIKLAVDIFDDEKILLIESRPDADAVLVIWIKLLALAGKTNNSGVFVFAKDIPYTSEMLATIFRRPVEAVQTALQCFEDFGMIELVDGVITIPNWEKHQAIDELERIREQNRRRKQRQRERQKQILNDSDSASVDGHVTGHGKITGSHATEEKRKEENKYIVEIVSHLNDVCGTRYLPSTRETQKHILARLREGHKLEDFIKVIDVKAEEWLADGEMKKFLRPQTLFGTNFEAYLNQDAVGSSGSNRRATSHEEIEAMKKAEGAV